MNDMSQELKQNLEPVYRHGVLYNCDVQIAEWMQKRLPGTDDELPGSFYKAFGIVNPEKSELKYNDLKTTDLMCGIYFYNHYPERRDLSCAIVSNAPLRMISPVSIQAVLSYPFLECNVTRITAEIDVSNEDYLKLAEDFGFKVEGIKEECGIDGKGTAILGYLKKDCKYFGKSAQGDR